MPLFGAASPRRVVVRTCGRDSLIGLASPLLALAVRALGMQLRLGSEEQVGSRWSATRSP
jgi:hypothetical protein